MTLSSIVTYDQDAPRRPTIDDLGGGAFQDHPQYPPNPTEHPSAGMFNQASKQIVAIARMTPSLKIQVEFIAGFPQITQLVTTGTTIKLSHFFITHNGDGDTTILLPPSKYPSQLTRPSGLTIVEDVEVDRMRIISLEAVGWRIKTKLGATGVDAAFVFQVN
jgi:hypothetical protein